MGLISTKTLATEINREKLETPSEIELEKPSEFELETTSETEKSDRTSEQSFHAEEYRNTKSNTDGTSDPHSNNNIFPRVESLRRPGNFHTYNRSSYNRIPFRYKRNTRGNYGSGRSNIQAYSAVSVRNYTDYSFDDLQLSRGLSEERVEMFKRFNAHKEHHCTICTTSVGGKIDEVGGKVIELDCGHVFCDKCIGKWFEQNTTCPNCRKNYLC